jgi:hypothetical protein
MRPSIEEFDKAGESISLALLVMATVDALCRLPLRFHWLRFAHILLTYDLCQRDWKCTCLVSRVEEETVYQEIERVAVAVEQTVTSVHCGLQLGILVVGFKFT